MNTRPIADQIYRKTMQCYEEEDQKRTEVLRIIVKQRIQSAREPAAALYAFYKSVTATGKLKSSSN